MKVFISRLIPEIAATMIREAGHDVTQFVERRDIPIDEMIELCKGHEGFLNVSHNKLDKHFLEASSHLKVLSLFSVGYDHVDIAAATKLKIPVGHTPGVLSASTADTAFMLMLTVSRKAFYLHKSIGKGEWNYYDPIANLGMELTGKTLGILGLGKIGFEMAKRCKGAYDMKVIYHNRGTNPEAEKAFDAERVSFADLLNQSDVLSVHSSLNSETAGLFNAAAFKQMKPTSIFINTSRGGLHNEADLLNALTGGTIWGAGLDVTNPEPMNADNPLLNLPNVAIVPHIGSATIEARTGMARIAAMNIIAGLNGERLPYPVNPEIYK
ncbi:MAG: D-glycerate dehydrogenase [Chitinophagaceae bacterium]|nr:D-glycerate dehydrogenase [Chitinophagaceae bacterium]